VTLNRKRQDDVHRVAREKLCLNLDMEHPSSVFTYSAAELSKALHAAYDAGANAQRLAAARQRGGES
jgi:hypothetical protein